MTGEIKKSSTNSTRPGICKSAREGGVGVGELESEPEFTDPLQLVNIMTKTTAVKPASRVFSEPNLLFPCSDNPWWFSIARALNAYYTGIFNGNLILD